MAYLPAIVSPEGAPLEINLGQRKAKAVTQKTPFYKKQEVARATTSQ
jgi:hypothetical protein